MAAQPNISFRIGVSPYAPISPLVLSESAPDGYLLPVLFGENSDTFIFRIYNNYELQAGIASATSVYVTTFDGQNSHTAIQTPIAQSWLKIYQTGYGEGATTPGTYTKYIDSPIAIGKAGTDKYTPAFGSDGTATSQIRAGTDTNGCGFIEFAVFIEAPDSVIFANYPFVIAVSFNWTP